MPQTMIDYDGTEVEVEHVKPLSGGGARLNIEHPDGRRWLLDVTRNGSTEIVTTWRDGDLANLEVPEWLDDTLSLAAQPV